MRALIFPGQGSQHPEMGKALADAHPAARQTFEEADDALGFALSKICFEGSEDELRRTEITQPAILTHSIAVLRALQAQGEVAFDFAAGHSLGEWSAWVAVGALSFADAVRSVNTRGRLMQEAVPEGKGAMSAVMGMEPDQVAAVCQQVAERLGEVVAPANYNSPPQTVISGTSAAVAAANEALTEAGASKVVPLSVSAPFHSELMAPAATGLATAIDGITVSAPKVPVVTNVEATENADPERVKALLVQQVTSAVRWVESCQRLKALGVEKAWELGPGSVLRGLMRRIDRDIKVQAAGDPTAMAKLD